MLSKLKDAIKIMNEIAIKEIGFSFLEKVVLLEKPKYKEEYLTRCEKLGMGGIFLYFEKARKDIWWGFYSADYIYLPSTLDDEYTFEKFILALAHEAGHLYFYMNNPFARKVNEFEKNILENKNPPATEKWDYLCLKRKIMDLSETTAYGVTDILLQEYLKKFPNKELIKLLQHLKGKEDYQKTTLLPSKHFLWFERLAEKVGNKKDALKLLTTLESTNELVSILYSS